MLSPERQKRIYEIIKHDKSASVTDLSVRLETSVSTVRRDLSEMETQGLIQRVHGGAVLVEDNREPARPQRQNPNLELKERIGAAAARLVNDGDTIILGPSTTVEAMIPYLAEKRNLTIITNMVNIAYKLVIYPHIMVVVLGGWLRHSEFSLLGHLTQAALKDLYASKIFHGTYGLDPNYGLTSLLVQEVETDRHLINAAAQLIVLADSSKFSQVGPIRLIPAERIHTLITDSGVSKGYLAKMEEQGVQIIVV